MNDFVRNILQNKFYAYCYILLSGTRRCTPICGAAMLLRCHWCRNLAAFNCIVHWIVLTLSTLHTRNSSCITLLWLHHNHKMSISFHKNGLVTSHQTVGKWFIFMCFVIRMFWWKLVGYQQPSCLCVMMEFVVGTISVSFELCSLSKAAFVHVRPAQLCTENGISIYMCSAVEVAWLA